MPQELVQVSLHQRWPRTRSVVGRLTKVKSRTARPSVRLRFLHGLPSKKAWTPYKAKSKLRPVTPMSLCDVCQANKANSYTSLYVCHSVLAGLPKCHEQQPKPKVLYDPLPTNTRAPSFSQMLEAKMKVDMYLECTESMGHVNLHRAALGEELPDQGLYPMYKNMTMISFRDGQTLDWAVAHVVSTLFDLETSAQDGQQRLVRH